MKSNLLKNRLPDFWFQISDKIRFLIVGTFNAGFSYLIYAGICHFCGESLYQTALVIAWVLTSITSFLTQRFLVFNVEGNLVKQYLKCCLTWFFSYIINAILLNFWVEKIGLNVYISQVIATCACAIFNYIMFKVFAFRKKCIQGDKNGRK